MVKVERNVRVFNTDRIARQVFHNLVGDFQELHGHDFCRKQHQAFMAEVSKFRDCEWPTLGEVGVARFKARHQLQNLLKKYRFEKDKFSNDELLERTREGYKAAQLSFKETLPQSATTYAVLKEARRICKDILGEFSQEELMSNARFGKRASIGCGFNNSYLDYKLSVPKALTGTAETVEWFFGTYLPSDSILADLVHRVMGKSKRNSLSFAKKVKANVHDFNVSLLNLVEVPKSWKILRGITPLTLIALFYSYGFGSMVSARLKHYGLDIRKLQSLHRDLACEFSRTRRGATADLERASDSIMSVLLNAVLPRPWYNALKKTFSRQIKIGDETFYTASILPMGNGATFPVETLVFYSLIKAVGNLLGKRGVYSVYGDDLIYPSGIHPYVAKVFSSLGITINRDKTYVSASFRESCGGDYYHGSDVRPFILSGEYQLLTRSRYLAALYKTYNGLIRRWDECEIPKTLRWLLLEMLDCTREIHQVPASYPDTAGIKTTGIRKDTWIPWMQPQITFEDGSVQYKFRWLLEQPTKRVVESVGPYYWAALSGNSDSILPWETEVEHAQRRKELSRLVRSKWRHVKVKQHLTYLRDLTCLEPDLQWIKLKKVHGPNRHKSEYVPHVSSKSSTRVVDEISSMSFWA